MRTRRFTFKFAFHHVMNHSLNDEPLFKSNQDKDFFLSLLLKFSSLYKIRILSFCIMDTHYHIILQNTSDRLSQFMRQLNSVYALYFRRKYGGKGYVFQDRFKSTLIQDNTYLFTAILYTLLNPVRANMVKNPFDYKYSSIKEYFNNRKMNKITDNEYVEGIYGTEENFIKSIIDGVDIKGIERSSKFGRVIGGDKYIEEIEDRINSREEEKVEHPNMREKDYAYKGVKEVIRVFEVEIKQKIEEIDIRRKKGKRLRLKLLKELREEAGLKYKEINKISIFKKIKYYSLSHMYIYCTVHRHFGIF